MRDVPDDIREYSVKADPNIGGVEKETTIRFSKETDRMAVFTEVATFAKWLLSVEESELDQCRLHDGDVVALKGTVPKGMLHCKPESRKSQQHNTMVSYGPHK